MWGLFVTLIVLLTTGTFSTEGKLFLRRGVPPAKQRETRASVEWSTFTQRVDHFNSSDSRRWQMRYIRNDEFYTEGSPMFVIIGGEWNITTDWITSGLFYDLAQEQNAILFQTEHRFYGGSYPINDLRTSSLKYLTPEQALEDLKSFIEYQKQNTAGLQNSIVVVQGSSYAGALATWAREKYPDVVDIAYSSSGPLHAKADFTEYYEVVEEDLRLASSTCPTLIRAAMAEISDMLKTRQGSAKVSDLFRTCSPLDGSVALETSYFFSTVAVNFGDVAQYSQPGDLEKECNRLENQRGSNAEKLANYIGSTSGCMGSYQDYIQSLSDIRKGTNDDSRQWLYQTCSAFGWFLTRGFGNLFTVDLYYQICVDVFGNEFNANGVNIGIQRTNSLYGSTEPKVTRLITCHGTADPWYKMGLLRSLSKDVITIVVSGTSHSADLSSISSDDSDEMQRAKTRIMNTITSWINEINGS